MTFDGWLGQQLHREDEIGDLAREAATDPGWPRGGTDVDRAFYLADIGATSDTHRPGAGAPGVPRAARQAPTPG